MNKDKLLAVQKVLNKGDLEIVEVANMGNWLEARIHSAFSSIADDMFGNGYLSRDERIGLSGAIGDALNTFNTSVEENVPQLYNRKPFDDAPETGSDGTIVATEKKKKLKEPAALDKCVAKVMKQGHDKSTAFAICQATLGEGDMPDGIDEETLKLAREELQVSESNDLDGDFIPLLEKAVRQDGTIPIKIIEPGWGSSGYYPAEVLERDGPNVFAEGIKLYWNHPTLTEDVERPERDLKDLAAELVGSARWVSDHPSGAGLYGDAKVFTPFQDAVDELAPHIGVSIRAKGKVEPGQAEGKSGPIVKEITTAKSVDFVTEPGAGGKILQLFEAQRGVGNISNSGKETKMDEKEIKALQEAHDQLEKDAKEASANLAKLQKDMLERDAGDYVAEALVKVDLPKVVRSRLLQSLIQSVPAEDGKIDKEAYDKIVKEALQAELTYLSEVTGTDGKITGMGSEGGPELTDEQAEEKLEKAFARLGLSESASKVAALGR